MLAFITKQMLWTLAQELHCLSENVRRTVKVWSWWSGLKVKNLGKKGNGNDIAINYNNILWASKYLKNEQNLRSFFCFVPFNDMQPLKFKMRPSVFSHCRQMLADIPRNEVCSSGLKSQSNRLWWVVSIHFACFCFHLFICCDCKILCLKVACDQPSLLLPLWRKEETK